MFVTDIQSLYPPNGESSNKNVQKEGVNKEAANSALKNKPKACFKCWQPGNYINECPNRRSDSRAGVDVEDGEPKFDENPLYDEHEREEIGPEEGDCLVIQRVLAAPKQDDGQSWLRRNIFRTKCTSHGKVCSLVIDGGSFENFVSQEMVDKLKLPTVPHPDPYSVSWIKKDNEVRVNKRCLVSFSMGKTYRDEVWCDVTPMDIGNILLGRPWQYDKGVTHDGRKNTYTFMMGKVEITLLPSKSVDGSDVAVTRKGSILLTAPQFNERFHVGAYNKFKEKKMGPRGVLDNNAYKIELPTHIRTHPTFNVRDLIPFHEENTQNSETSSFPQGENDAVPFSLFSLKLPAMTTLRFFCHNSLIITPNGKRLSALESQFKYLSESILHIFRFQVAKELWAFKFSAAAEESF